jgi:DNA-directed RNA polymerase specialized sigma24 family protein
MPLLTTPSSDFLAQQVRWAMGRGLPPQVAEDVVFEAWEQAAAAYDPARGRFEPFMQGIVRNACAYWWRRHGRTERVHAHLRLLPDPEQATDHAEACQQQLLDALDDDDRDVFAAWALQKHLGKGQVQAADVGASIGLSPREFENAKRRLKDQLKRLLARFGWTVADLIQGAAHADRTG